MADTSERVERQGEHIVLIRCNDTDAVLFCGMCHASKDVTTDKHGYLDDPSAIFRSDHQHGNLVVVERAVIHKPSRFMF